MAGVIPTEALQGSGDQWERGPRPRQAGKRPRRRPCWEAAGAALELARRPDPGHAVRPVSDRTRQIREHPPRQLHVAIVSAEPLIERTRLDELERLQAFSFSAAFDIRCRSFIVTNSLRSPGRSASDVAHELAHLLLAHDLTEVREPDGVVFPTCRPDQQEQATSFGGTQLLPRPLPMDAAGGGLEPAEMAAVSGVTVEMARLLFNTTGVARQVRPPDQLTSKGATRAAMRGRGAGGGFGRQAGWLPFRFEAADGQSGLLTTLGEDDWLGPLEPLALDERDVESVRGDFDRSAQFRRDLGSGGREAPGSTNRMRVGGTTSRPTPVEAVTIAVTCRRWRAGRAGP